METSLDRCKELGATKLADIDSEDMMVALRHQYLSAAKDLVLRHGSNELDVEFGLALCEIAEGLQTAIDTLSSWNH